MNTVQQLHNLDLQQTSSPQVTSQRRLRKRSAVIVDDDVDSLQILGGLLGFYQIASHTLDTSTLAHELIQVIQPGFVITDLLMPGKNGWNLLSEIKQHSSTQHIPVIATTAYFHPTLAVEAANAGFRGIIAKPVDQSEFYKIVRQVLTND